MAITWNTDHEPQIGDMGQVMEWDARVVTVHPGEFGQPGRVSVEIIDEIQGNRLVEMDYRIIWG